MNTFNRRNNAVIAILAVASTTIVGAAYDRESNTVAIEFPPSARAPEGQVYHYFDVPDEKGAQLESLIARNRAGEKDASVGSYFHTQIKPVHAFQRISPDVGPVKNPDGTVQAGYAAGETQTQEVVDGAPSSTEQASAEHASL